MSEGVRVHGHSHVGLQLLSGDGGSPVGLRDGGSPASCLTLWRGGPPPEPGAAMTGSQEAMGMADMGRTRHRATWKPRALSGFPLPQGQGDPASGSRTSHATPARTGRALGPLPWPPPSPC